MGSAAAASGVAALANYRAMARAAARKYHIPANLFERQIGAESGFNPTARSPAGAQGIAQIMPATARGWGVNPLNPGQALDAAAKNMSRYTQQFGGYENALRAYNAGPGNVQASRGFGETNAYVKKIMQGHPADAVDAMEAAVTGGGKPRTVVTDPGRAPSVTPAQTVGALTPKEAATSALQSRVSSSNPATGKLPSLGDSTRLKGMVDLMQRTGQKVGTQFDPGEMPTLGTVPGAAGAPGAGGETGTGSTADFVRRANAFEKAGLPYKWGGGHAGRVDLTKGPIPVDCSGAVSAVLGIDPRVSGQFTKWGKPGAGGNVTVYANRTHVLMKVRTKNGWRFFGTSKSNRGGGAGWIDASQISPAYLSRFTARHSS